MARTYQLNSRPRLLMSLTDVAGTPANGTVTLTVTSPTGTVSTPTVVNDSTGEYHADFDVAVEGLWTYVWRSTGAVIDSREGSLYVGSTTSIVSLQDAKAHLNITTDDEDDELDGFLDAATQWVESKIGPVVPRTITETHNPPIVDQLVLHNRPIVSFTSLTATYGVNVGFDYSYATLTTYPELDTGIVRFGPYSPTFAYPVTATYVAGRTIIPAAIRTACLMYLKSMWETQRGASELPIQGFSEEGVSDTGGLLVYKAEQLLEPYRFQRSVQ